MSMPSSQFPVTHSELVRLRRAAEDAIHAANPRYAPFIEAVANPLRMLAVVDAAMRGLNAADLPPPAPQPYREPVS